MEGPKKFKLIRRKPVLTDANQDIIAKNLEPLMQYTEKKRHAQELYYNNHPEISTLKLEPKGPVKLRLGGGRSNLPYGTNTSSLGPKPRKLRRLNTARIQRNQSQNSVQLRLLRIRQNQNNSLNQFQRKERLQRLKKQVASEIITKPQNLRVQVNNNHFNKQMNHIRKHRLTLNPRLQQEIKTLQSLASTIKYHLENFRPEPITTQVNMHNRFSML